MKSVAALMDPTHTVHATLTRSTHHQKKKEKKEKKQR